VNFIQSLRSSPIAGVQNTLKNRDL